MGMAKRNLVPERLGSFTQPTSNETPFQCKTQNVSTMPPFILFTALASRAVGIMPFPGTYYAEPSDYFEQHGFLNI